MKQHRGRWKGLVLALAAVSICIGLLCGCHAAPAQSSAAAKALPVIAVEVFGAARKQRKTQK